MEDSDLCLDILNWKVTRKKKRKECDGLRLRKRDWKEKENGKIDGSGEKREERECVGEQNAEREDGRAGFPLRVFVLTQNRVICQRVLYQHVMHERDKILDKFYIAVSYVIVAF